MKIRINKEKIEDILICIIFSISVLIFFSMNTSFHSINPNPDVYAYATMGLGLLRGKIPYVDLFDHKGIILYFVWAALVMLDKIFGNGFFIGEIITFTIFLYYNLKIIKLYNKENRILNYILVLIIMIVSGNARWYSNGATIEDLSLCMFSCSIYHILKSVKEGKAIENKSALIIGIFTAIAFWTKFSLCCIYLGFILFVILYYIFKKFKIKQLLEIIKWFLIGFGSVTFIVLIYFVCTGSLKAMYHDYFYSNIFSYTKSNFKKEVFFRALTNPLTHSFLVTEMIIFGLLGMLINFKNRKYELLLSVLTITCFFLVTFRNFRFYDYYYSPLFIFIVFMAIVFIDILNALKLKNGPKILLTAVCLLAIGIDRFGGVDVKKLLTDNKTVAQQKFAETINESDDKTMLFFNGLDKGFYYFADVVPSQRIFYIPNIEDDYYKNKQIEAIKNKKINFLITTDKNSVTEIEKMTNGSYEIIDIQKSIDGTYILWKRK